MARQALGLDTGRYAYSLPCGGGKTQGAIALIVAAWELGLNLSFAVATSQVEALCEFKQQLLEHHGVPESAIGLWHSLQVDPDKAKTETGYASLPATPENEGRPILLLSHQRIKGGNVEAFNGKPRSLLIWDESLIATQAKAVPLRDIRVALGAAREYAPVLVPLLEKVARVATAELTALQGDPWRRPRVLHEVLAPDELEGLRTALGSSRGNSRFEQAMRVIVATLLRLLELPVSVAETGSGAAGDGVLRYEVLVPTKLENIAILDASHSIRLLTQADRSIVDRTTREMQEYRQYHNVTVRIRKMHASKGEMTESDAGSMPHAREIAQYLEGVPADECVLIFTFKDALSKLRKNLEKLGVDLSQSTTVDGARRPRVQFLTWGHEAGRNDMRHCQHVIMAGVLRRNPLDLAASLTAQQQEAQPRRNSHATLADVSLSEVAHCVLQATHRGACRMSDEDGEAKRTSVLILASGLGGLPAILSEAMPGVQWIKDNPAPRKRANSRTSGATAKIVQYLTGPDAPTEKVSVAALHKLPGTDLCKSVFSDALDIALVECRVHHRSPWRRVGRSLVRDTT